jgi:hypothetical protein
MRFAPRFDLSTMLLATGLVACTIASIRLFGVFGLLLGHLIMLSFATALLAIITLIGFVYRKNLISRRRIALAAIYASMPLLYFASYGPATWVLVTVHEHGYRFKDSYELHTRIYAPVTRCIVDSPDKTIHDTGVSYLRWWMPTGAEVWNRGRQLGWRSKTQGPYGLRLYY